MIEASKLKLGLFISCGTVLFILCLLALGLSNIFEQKYQFFTIFDESVQGLENGAEIKYKGVKIGQVKKISVWKKRYVRVDMEYEPDAVFSENVSQLESKQERVRAVQEFLGEEVSKGLRCTLEISSLATGLKFIELTHIDHSRKLEVKVDIANKDGYLPAMKSLLSGAITNFDKTLTNIAKVDYEGIGIEAKRTLINLNKILSSPNIIKILERSDNTLVEITKTTQNLNSKIDELKFKEMQDQFSTVLAKTDKSLSASFTKLDTSMTLLTTSLGQSLANFNTTIEFIHKEFQQAKLSDTTAVARKTMERTSLAVGKVETEATTALKQATLFLSDLHKMEKDINLAIKSVEAAGGSMSGLRGDFTSTLKRFKTTLDSLRSFIDYLEKDPSALIRGKAE
jgi:paraquat-inducible protein B